MKQFVKALDKDGECYAYLGHKNPTISDAKLKEGIFDDSQIRTMLKDEAFVVTMNNEKAAWLSFKKVVENFLGNHKSDNYAELVADLLRNYQKLLSDKLQVTLSPFTSRLFSKNLNFGDYSEEQGERFHQDIKEMEYKYDG